MGFNTGKIITLCNIVVLSLCVTAYASAPYRVASAYEDSVRIMILWNDATGYTCDDVSTTPVGRKTMDFVVNAIDTLKVDNVKILVNSKTNPATWNQIVTLWGTRLPHVIVHVNAGWSTGWNGVELDTIFSKAIQNKIGIVSVGDDAANLASKTFGFSGVENIPAPLDDGTEIDSLWIGLLRANDEKMKKFRTIGNDLEYPGVNGIISNAIDSILHKEQVSFLPVGKGRCQADADMYTILYPQWITMLGYQQGLINNKATPGVNELNVLVAIQDTLKNDVIRRGVALSFQPQFLRDSIAMQQICYDAILFASLTHTLSVASKIVINVNNDSLIAGQSVSLTAQLFDQHGNSLDTMLQYVKWTVINPDTNDTLSDSSGGYTEFTGTKAWRTVTLRAEFTDPENGTTIFTTAEIVIVPATSHHIDILTDSAVSGNELTVDNAPVNVEIVKTVSSLTLFAVVRDRYGNYIGRSDADATVWTSDDVAIVTAAGIDHSMWIGTVSRAGSAGSVEVTASANNLITDKAFVAVDVVAVLQRAVTRDVDGDGLIDRVELYFDSLIRITDVNTLSNELSIVHNADKFTIESVSSKSESDSVYYINLKEITGSTLQTDWTLDISGQLTVQLSEGTTGKVSAIGTALDGIGAVINKAMYLFAEKSETGDTIKVTFSEPVRRTDIEQTALSDMLVYYSDKTGTEIALFNGARVLYTSEDEYVTNVTVLLNSSVTREFTITPFRDLLQLVNALHDRAGNLPPSKEIARKTIVETSGANIVKIAIVPNPVNTIHNNLREILVQLSPDGSVLRNYQNIIQQYESRNGGSASGIMVSVNSKKTLAEKNGSFGNVVIYDAVGHIVVKSMNLKKAYNSQDYAYIWNGRNDQGRMVGAGTYLMFITVTDTDGMLYIDKKKVGIKYHAVIGQ